MSAHTPGPWQAVEDEQHLEAAKKEADEALGPSATTEIYTARVVPSVDLLMFSASRIGWRCSLYVAEAAEDDSVLDQVIAPLTREQERALGRHIINWYRARPGTVARAWVAPGTPEATTGNARLTAAAPDLLAALQALVAELDGPGKPDSSDSYAPEHFVTAAKAAIAKATNGASK